MEYDALIDGGDTDALLARIAGTTWHQAVADLRGQLLAISPTDGRPVGSCPLRRGLLRGRVVRASPTPAGPSVSKPGDHQRIAPLTRGNAHPFAGPVFTCRINCLGSITGRMMPLKKVPAVRSILLAASP
ncbi:MAG: hypothetical protein RBT71_12950 [Flavobacteriales bacterium]|nr:hypothetical protein [Flavobacteriales bacterium]